MTESSSVSVSNHHSIEAIKRKATKIKKSKGISHSKALDLAAVEVGFTNWKNFLNSNPVEKSKKTKVPYVFRSVLDHFTELEALSLSEWGKRVRLIYKMQERDFKGLLLMTVRKSADKQKVLTSLVGLVHEMKFNLASTKPLFAFLESGDEGKVFDALDTQRLIQEDLEDYYTNRNGFDEIGILATHVYVDDVSIHSVDFEIDGDKILASGSFELSIELEYGSGSDNRNDDGHGGSLSISGDFEVEMDFEENIEIVSSEIDLSSYYE